MTPTTYLVPDELTSPRFGHAFAQGCGGQAVALDMLLPGPVALFGSPKRWDLLARARAAGRAWYYGDHAYFKKLKFFRVTKGRLQHDGSGAAAPDRFQELGLEIRPWRTGGTHILICPPRDAFAALNGFDAREWLHGVRAELLKHSSRPHRIRQKPDTQTPAVPLEADLVNCWALVCWTSNTAVDALRLGIPVFPLGDCAASACGSKDLSRIEAPDMPAGREQLLWNLAANQWTVEEIARGDCWEVVK